jgi:hypothetical protein
MSYDESDAWQEAAMDSLYDRVIEDPQVRNRFYEELNDEIVRDFTDGRLRSFFEEVPKAAEPAAEALSDGRRFLKSDDHTAAFVFASIAADVGLISTLLRPIVHGLVHAEGAASLIARLAIKHSDENLVRIMLDLLAEHGRVDPRTHKRAGSKRSLWEEMKEVKTKRNRVIHQAERASREEAELALAVAGTILEELFPTLVVRLGLRLRGMTVFS